MRIKKYTDACIKKLGFLSLNTNNLEIIINNILFVLQSEEKPYEGANIVLLDLKKQALNSYKLNPKLYSDPDRYKKMDNAYFNTSFPLNKKIWVSKVALDRTEIFISDMDSILKSFPESAQKTIRYLGYKSCYYLPLVYNNLSLGTLLFYETQKIIFLKEDEKNHLRELREEISKIIYKISIN